MDSINCQSIPPSFEEIENDDETQPPSQPLGSHQGIFIAIFLLLVYDWVSLLLVILNTFLLRWNWTETD